MRPEKARDSSTKSGKLSTLLTAAILGVFAASALTYLGANLALAGTTDNPLTFEAPAWTAAAVKPVAPATTAGTTSTAEVILDDWNYTFFGSISAPSPQGQQMQQQAYQSKGQTPPPQTSPSS